MLELRDVSLRLRDRQILDRIDVRVPPGRVVGLLGPNGAGKTTAMRVLFGIVDPDAGEVCWRGRPATEADRASWGYMPQERGLYPKMPVHDQLVYFARLRGMPRDRARAETDALLEALDLSERGGDRLERLSGGMAQRVQLAATLVHAPEVIVLDEPFSGLDPVAVDQLSAVVTRQAEAGHTVLFSSHQLDLVEDLCETIVLLDHGRVVLAGDVHELKAASGRRTLRVSVDGGATAWADAVEGAEIVRRDASELRLALGPGTDPLAVLDAARRAGPVHDFGLEQPRLSELFHEAVCR